MYIVEKGTLEVIHPTSGKIVKTLGKGSWFGELAILAHAGARRSMHIRAKTICELYVIRKDDLFEAFRDYPARQRTIPAGTRLSSYIDQYR